MEILTVAEFARKWKVSRKAVYQWAKKGRLPSVRLGRALRIVDAPCHDKNDHAQNRDGDGRTGM